MRAFSHQTFRMSLINQMDSTCIKKNTVSGIRLIGQKYQAKLVSEPGGAASMPPQILGPGLSLSIILSVIVVVHYRFVHHCCHPSFSLFDVHYCCHLHRRCSGLSLLSLSASSIISIITCVHLRPRPVGGDSSPPGFHPDTLAPPPPKEDQLVIGVIIVLF